MLLFIAFLGFLLGAFLTAKLSHNERVANIALCVGLWLILPFALPFKAKSYGLINKSIYAWLLVLFSPIGIGICIILALSIAYIVALSKTVPYEKLSFTSREEIAAIAEMPDFPEFEYLTHSHDGWNGSNYIENRFKDTTAVVKFLGKLQSKVSEAENVYWTRVPLTSKKDKKFFGCDEIYICKRGWDIKYSRSPKGIKHNAHVSLHVGKNAFTVRESVCWVWDMDYYSSADSLSKLTGTSFPKYDVVNLEYWDGIDPAFEAILKLDKKPTKKILNAIQKAENWRLDEDGTYHFHLSDRKGDLWEDITIDPQSRIVKMSVSTH